MKQQILDKLGSKLVRVKHFEIYAELQWVEDSRDEDKRCVYNKAQGITNGLLKAIEIVESIKEEE